MTLNAKIGVFMDFFGDFGLRDTFQERIAPKSFELDMAKLHMKFSALNAKFRWSKSRFSSFKKTCARRHQRAVPPKSRYFTVVGQSFMKTVADRHGHAAYHNKH